MTKTTVNECVTFLLIAKFDTMERLENAMMVIDYLMKHFQAKVMLWEVSPYKNGFVERLLPTGVEYTFRQDYDTILHRTAYLNEMVLSASSQFVAVWDIDVIVPPQKVEQCVDLLRKGADFVYPYRFCFLDTSKEIRQMYFETREMETLMSNISFMTSLYGPRPVGGAFMANRRSYIDLGLENTRFYGWGLEDGERITRWKAQKRSIQFVDGPLFHLSHPRNINSEYSSDNEGLQKRRVYIQSQRCANHLAKGRPAFGGKSANDGE